MLSVDTNILLYALHERMEGHERARQFLRHWGKNTDFVICELVLVELYQLLRNPLIFGREVGAGEAVEVIRRFRKNPRWIVVESAPVMGKVWNKASEESFARRRLFDVRLAFTLQHHGVTHFATANVKDFQELGFEEVWNPLVDEIEL